MTDVLILIKGLGLGGAERLIASAAPYLSTDRFNYRLAYVLPWKDALAPEIGRYMDIEVLGDERGRGWAKHVTDLVRSRRFDVVHAHSPLLASVVRVSRPRNTKMVYTEHNLWQRYSKATYLANLTTYPRNDHVFAVSTAVARSIHCPPPIRRFLPEIEILPPGIETAGAERQPADPVDLRRDSDEKLVVCVANFKAHKGHRYLVEAIPEVLAAVPRTLFALIGTGPEEATIRAGVAEAGLEDAVLFTGPRTDARAIVAACDAFVLPSVAEGLPIALVEAMGQGKPIVATCVGGVPEIIQDGVNGLLVRPRDADALAEALNRVLDDPSFASALGDRARETARGWDIRPTVRRMEHVYAELAG